MTTCEACGGPKHHFIARAWATKRWRGKSFDADQAMGNLGLGLMRALDLGSHDFERFADLVMITPFREVADLNPPEKMPEGGEWWDFHVALRMDVDDEALERLHDAARAALEEAQNFEAPRVVS